MEEKERYVKYDPDNDDIITRIIYDTIEKKPIIVTADRCIDLLNQQDKENQQLKALLKATEVTDIHNELADLQINNEWLESENQQLKKQLEEKDEEIAYLTKQVKKFNNEAQKYFEDAYCNDFHNQDKISFAVEVLKIAQDYVQQYVNNFDDMNDCLYAIDNQIKQLKEGK